MAFTYPPCRLMRAGWFAVALRKGDHPQPFWMATMRSRASKTSNVA